MKYIGGETSSPEDIDFIRLLFAMGQARREIADKYRVSLDFVILHTSDLYHLRGRTRTSPATVWEIRDLIDAGARISTISEIYKINQEQVATIVQLHRTALGELVDICG